MKGIEDFCASRRLAAVESPVSVNCSCRNRRTLFEVDATVASTSHLFTLCTTSTAFCNKRHVASKREPAIFALALAFENAIRDDTRVARPLRCAASDEYNMYITAIIQRPNPA